MLESSRPINKRCDASSTVTGVRAVIREYQRDLRPNWQARIEVFVEEVEASKNQAAQARDDVVAEHEMAVNSLEQDKAKLRLQASGHEGELTAKVSRLIASAKERIDALEMEGEKDLFPQKEWSRVSVATTPTLVSHLGEVRPPASILDATNAPLFKRIYLPIAFGVLLIGWWLFTFSTSAILTALVLACLAFWVQSKSNAILSEIGEVLNQVASDAASERSRHAQFLEIKNQQIADREADRDKLNLDLQKALADCKQREQQERARFRSKWDELCAQIDERSLNLSSRFESIVSRASPRLSPFDEKELELSETQLDLQEKLAIRIGQADSKPLAALGGDCSTFLGIERTPKSLAAKWPIMHDFTEDGTLLVRSNGSAEKSLSPKLIDGAVARILMQLDPGEATFTLFDPLGLGANFGPFLSLLENSEKLIGPAVWTRPEQIKKRLQDLISHIEMVTQKYLKADHETIEQYHEELGSITEPYRFLVIHDFPHAFDQDSLRDLVRIVQSGPRCGVHTIIHWNESDQNFHGFSGAELIAASRSLSSKGNGVWEISKPGSSSTSTRWLNFTVDEVPNASTLSQLTKKYGELAEDALTFVVNFESLVAKSMGADEWWSGKANNEISVPIGARNAKEAVLFALDSEQVPNALLVGRPGSGKSNLLHVFIAAAVQKYSPEELQLYLVDFKKGVEFVDYATAGLPHARVIAVESEREFGLSVLRAIDKELTVRSELFKSAGGVANIAQYREQIETNPDRVEPNVGMPRIVLIIDEFQELFSKEDKLKNEAAELLERIVRQGRGFGVHVILATQTLRNAGLPESTIGQIPIRIAMQCSESDSVQILASNNVEARSLSRQGEAIYNDRGGELEGNKHLQVAYLDEGCRKAHLATLGKIEQAKNWDGRRPRIFEGDVREDLASCSRIQKFNPVTPASKLRCWLGEPVSLDDSVGVDLAPDATRNLVVVSKEEKQAVDLVLSVTTSIVTQLKPRDVSFEIVDLSTADASWADFPEAFRDFLPYQTSVMGKHDLKELLPKLCNEIEERQASLNEKDESAPLTFKRVFFVLIGGHRARTLRRSEEQRSMMASLDPDCSPDFSSMISKIAADGPEVGVQTILWVDSVANFERMYDRLGWDHFGIRVSGALSDRDSRTVFDEPVASEMGNKPNRMIKYDDDEVGVLSAFRPYLIQSEQFFENLRNTVFSDPK